MEQAHHRDGWHANLIAAFMWAMEDDLIVKALRDKRAEIHGRITAYEAQIEQAKHDLAHVNGKRCIVPTLTGQVGILA